MDTRIEDLIGMGKYEDYIQKNFVFLLKYVLRLVFEVCAWSQQQVCDGQLSNKRYWMLNV
jgi:hypothetical protein